jgi:hypothetical protein
MFEVGPGRRILRNPAETPIDARRSFRFVKPMLALWNELPGLDDPHARLGLVDQDLLAGVSFTESYLAFASKSLDGCHRYSFLSQTGYHDSDLGESNGQHYGAEEKRRGGPEPFSAIRIGHSSVEPATQQAPKGRGMSLARLIDLPAERSGE